MSDRHTTNVVERFVETLLNGGDLSLLEEIVSRDFVDHDPLFLPPLFIPKSNPGRLADLRDMIGFLVASTHDIKFHIEDLIVQEDRAALRFFGEGVVLNLVEHLPDRPVVGNVLGGMFHIEIACTGIFVVRDGLLSERWGPIVMR